MDTTRQTSDSGDGSTPSAPVHDVQPPRWVTAAGAEYCGDVHSVDLKKGTAQCELPYPCSRCGGQGGGQQWAFTGYVCFECGGHGFRDRTRTCRLYSAARYAKLASARAKRTATLDAKRAVAEEARLKQRNEWRDEKIAEFNAAHPGFAERLRLRMEGNTFLADLHRKLTEEYGCLSDAQVEAAEKAIERAIIAAASSFIDGEIGDRVKIALTVEHIIIPDAESGSLIPPSRTYLCRDATGNKVVYRGRSDAMPRKGETSTLVATIKDFSNYKGTKQTTIARPAKPRDNALPRKKKAHDR